MGKTTYPEEGIMVKKEMYCKNCGYAGEPKRCTRGYFAIELLLWCLILPGLCYSLWRYTNRYTACPECGAENMIPRGSRFARQPPEVAIAPDPVSEEEMARRRIEATLPPQDATGRFIIK